MAAFATLYRRFTDVLTATVVVLLVATAALTAMRTFLTYGFNADTFWILDLSIQLVGWLIALGLPLAVSGTRELTPLPRRPGRAIGAVCLIGIFLFLTLSGLDDAMRAIAFGVRLDIDPTGILRRAWFDLALPTGCLLASAVVIVRLFVRDDRERSPTGT